MSGPFSNEAAATVGDTQAPSAPGTLSAVGSVGQATLSWAAATDNVGVLRYNVHRGTSAGFTPVGGEPDRAADHARLRRHDRARLLLLQGHRRGRGRQHRPRLERGAPRPSPPTRPRPAHPAGSTAPVTGTTVNLSLDRLHRQRRRHPLQRPPRQQRRLHPQRRQPDRATDRHQLRRQRPRDRHLLLQGHRRRRRRQHQRRLQRGHRHHRRRDPAQRTRHPHRHRRRQHDQPQLGRRHRQRRRQPLQPPPRHHAAASPPPPPTGSRNRPGSATPTPASPPAPTSTSSPPKTPPATSARSATPPPPPSPTPPRPAPPPSAPTAAPAKPASAGPPPPTTSPSPATTSTAPPASGFTPTTANRIAQPTGTSYTDTGLTAGTYYYKLTAEDAAGNTSTRQQPSHRHRHRPTRHRPRRRLRPRHRHRHHHHRPIRHRQQRHPQQHHLGRHRQRQIRQRPHLQRHQRHRHHPRHQQPRPHHRHDPRSLGPTHQPRHELADRAPQGSDRLRCRTRSTRTAATPGRWCRPASSSAAGYRDRRRDVLARAEHLDAHRDHVRRHDAAALRQRRPGSGSWRSAAAITTSTGALRIGGNAIWGEYFQGDIDEIRIYNRALPATEIQADMNTSISAPDTTPPSAPGTLTATGGLGQIGARLGRGDRQRGGRALQRAPGHERRASRRRRRTGSRSRPGRATPTRGLAAGTYYYRVTAEDVAGNVGPAGNEASAAAAADSTPPTVAITAPASGATVSGVRVGDGDRDRQRHRRRRPVQARRRQPRRRGHLVAVLDQLGHVRGRRTAPHTLTAVARDGAGNSDDVGERPGDRLQHRLRRARRRVGVRRGQRHDDGRPVRPRQQRHAHERRLGDDRASSTTPSTSTARTLGWPSPDCGDARPDDRDDARGVGAAGRSRAAGGRRSRRTCPVGSRTALYSNTNGSFPGAEVSIGGTSRTLNGTRALPVGSWSHVAVTYDGSDAAPLRQRRQVSQLRRRRRAGDVGLGAAHRRQRRLGRVVQRHDRRGSGLQPRARSRARSRTTWSGASPPTRSRRRSSRGRRRPAPRGSTPALGDGAVQRADGRRQLHVLDASS